MKEEQFRFLESYPSELEAIKRQIKKYRHNGSKIGDGQVINILHRPWIGPQNWGLMIWQGAGQKMIDEGERSLGIVLPGFYKQFLSKINGCFLYDMSLFGLHHSFTRSNLLCHSLIEGNKEWMREYNINQKLFHFGCGTYSEDENVGYFYGENKFYSIRQQGTVVNEWNEFSVFLQDELSRAEYEMLRGVPKNVKLTVS